MKKVLIGVFFGFLFSIFFVSPSYVKADTNIGSVYIKTVFREYTSALYIKSDVEVTNIGIDGSGRLYGYNSSAPTNTALIYYTRQPNGDEQVLVKYSIMSGYIGTLSTPYSFTSDWGLVYLYNNQNDYINSLPPEIRPSRADLIWDNFYELFYRTYGFYPLPGSLYDLLRRLTTDGPSDDNEITYITMDPTPTPTPRPTPIPVQTVFVPDGNGNTTIIYQYPDPTTGVITQSPYNPNIENNITVNCDCDASGDSGNNTFGINPQDPYILTSSMIWADGFGVEIIDNPLTVANESQQSLAEAASDYQDSVNIVSNSFNILPVKWLTLVGLLGGILIIAGLIRTFLGG